MFVNAIRDVVKATGHALWATEPGGLMPLEAVKCASCGSPDVKEVKANTYFCNHCDGVLKYVDPNRATVQSTPAFCPCGNPVHAQCNLCGSVLCSWCDPLRTHADALAVVGFGYLCRGRDTNAFRLSAPDPALDGTARSGWWAVTEGRPAWQDHSGEEVIGLWFPTPKLVAVLSTMHPALRHACWACTVAVLPEAADQVSTGAICATPVCTDKAVAQCSCCESWFCPRCHVAHAPGVDTDDCLTALRVGPGSPVSYQEFFDIKFSVSGMCPGCQLEKQMGAGVLVDACREDPRLTSRSAVSLRTPVFVVKTGTTTRPEGRLLRKAYRVAEQCATQLSERLQEIVEGPCECNVIDETTEDGWWGLADERDKTEPAVAPGVLGAGAPTAPSRPQVRARPRR